MRGASLSDLHLGFRAFSSTTEGRNTREIDVERAWNAAVDGIIAEHEREPIGVVTIAGDIFHHLRVSDFAKKAFIDGVRRLLAARLIVIVLQGNHDAGRTAEVLTPIMLAAGLSKRIFIVTTPERIRLTGRSGLGTWVMDPHARRIDKPTRVSVACFPFVTRGDGAAYRLDPDPEADVNILVVHAAVKGDAEGDALPFFYGGDQALDVGREAERWDVIACGDFHEFRRLHPTRLAFYSGAIERTSSNIWQEEAPKGWVLWDTDAGTLEFIEVPTRPMYDESTALRIAGADDLNAMLHTMLPVEEYDGAIVRLKVPDFPRSERDHIAWETVRQLKSTCTQFYLDLRYAKAELVDLGDRRERSHGLSLAEEAEAFFADDAEDVRGLALSYLEVEASVEDVVEEVAHV